MALTVFGAADAVVGPVVINRDKAFGYRVAGTLAAGSSVVLETARSDEDSYTTVATFTAANTPAVAHYMSSRGWKFRLRCATLTAPDEPSGEIVST